MVKFRSNSMLKFCRKHKFKSTMSFQRWQVDRTSKIDRLSRWRKIVIHSSGGSSASRRGPSSWRHCGQSHRRPESRPDERRMLAVAWSMLTVAGRNRFRQGPLHGMSSISRGSIVCRI
uniref:(northern house mosquito) hypothetical protein n=1 Tax=Culex pipiens TaxID=7175 RepID=A0A8D8MFZ0_CULPI